MGQIGPVKDSIGEAEKTISKLNQMVIDYYFTTDETKIYLFLNQNGMETASKISKELKISRIETYRVISALQRKGILFSSFEKPTKFDAVEIEEVLEILSDKIRNQINDLAKEFRESHITINNKSD
ncbi:MAG: helix-turn-helix domain-containing protein [Nitrosopumilus sp.]